MAQVEAAAGAPVSTRVAGDDAHKSCADAAATEAVAAAATEAAVAAAAAATPGSRAHEQQQQQQQQQHRPQRRRRRRGGQTVALLLPLPLTALASAGLLLLLRRRGASRGADGVPRAGRPAADAAADAAKQGAPKYPAQQQAQQQLRGLAVSRGGGASLCSPPLSARSKSRREVRVKPRSRDDVPAADKTPAEQQEQRGERSVAEADAEQLQAAAGEGVARHAAAAAGPCETGADGAEPPDLPVPGFVQLLQSMGFQPTAPLPSRGQAFAQPPGGYLGRGSTELDADDLPMEFLRGDDDDDDFDQELDLAVDSLGERPGAGLMDAGGLGDMGAVAAAPQRPVRGAGADAAERALDDAFDMFAQDDGDFEDGDFEEGELGDDDFLGDDEMFAPMPDDPGQLFDGYPGGESRFYEDMLEMLDPEDDIDLLDEEGFDDDLDYGFDDDDDEDGCGSKDGADEGAPAAASPVAVQPGGQEGDGDAEAPGLAASRGVQPAQGSAS